MTIFLARLRRERVRISWVVALALGAAATGCSPTVIDHHGGGGAGAGGHGVTPVDPAPGSPVGPGNLAISQPFVTMSPPAKYQIPEKFKVVANGPDSVALVTPDVDETQVSLAAWPPTQIKVRHLFDANIDRDVALADNGDFTYAVGASKHLHASGLRLADRVTPDAIPSVVEWDPGGPMLRAIARQDGLTFAVLTDGGATIAAKTHFTVAREQSGAIEPQSGSVVCARESAWYDPVGALAIGDHFLAAVPGESSACGEVTKEKKISVVSSPLDGDVTATIMATVHFDEEVLGSWLRTRSGGAWLLVLTTDAIQIAPLSADGSATVAATALAATVASSTGPSNYVFDVVPSPDGGLFLTWEDSTPDDAGNYDLQIAHVDAAGALVERGLFKLPPGQFIHELGIAARSDHYVVFLGDTPNGDTATLDAIEISDAP